MDGALAQGICLIGHGREWLASRQGDPPRPEDDNSTFQYVAAVTFDFQASSGSHVPALDVSTWLAQRADRQITRLGLVTGLVDGRSWAILATGGPHQELWGPPSWTIGERDAPDRRIWRVAYQGISTRDVEIDCQSVAVAEDELLAALADARSFANKHRLEEWTDWFSQAEALATTADPVPRFHPDMLPGHGYSPQARRLLAIATGCWVFGGMGSWNDLPTEARDDPRYVAVSDRLHDAMWRAFAASVNAGLS